MDCLQLHGFLLNLEKSDLHPTQRIQHQGMILDTNRMKVFLTPARIKKMNGPGSFLLSTSNSESYATHPASGPHGGKYGCTTMGLSPYKGAPMVLSTLSTSNCSQDRPELGDSSPSPNQPSLVDQNIQSLWRKAPTRGARGTHHDRHQSFWLGGDLEPTNNTEPVVHGKLPINLLELRTIRLTLLHFTTPLKGRHILIRTDNVAAKCHINKQGGSRSSRLHEEALLFKWAEDT